MLTKRTSRGIVRRSKKERSDAEGRANKVDGEAKKRLERLIIKCLIVAVVGFGYLIFVRLSGWGIPCIFRLISGKYCPGCGISRMFVALSRFDIHAAFRYNPLVFCLLPFATVFGVRYAVSYVKTGRTEADKLETVLLVITMILTVAFWVLRNLPTLSFLAPTVV